MKIDEERENVNNVNNVQSNARPTQYSRPGMKKISILKNQNEAKRQHCIY